MDIFQLAETSTHFGQLLQLGATSRRDFARSLRAVDRGNGKGGQFSNRGWISRWKKMTKLRRREGGSGGVTDLDKQSANDM